MAIVYSYPKVTAPLATDVLLLTDTTVTAGKRKNKTKSIAMSDIATYVVDTKGAITGSGTISTIPLYTGAKTIGDSIVTQTGTGRVNILGDLSVQNQTTLDNTLDVVGASTLSSLTVNGASALNTLNVSGVSTLNTLNVGGNSTFSNAATFSQGIIVNADSTFGADVDFDNGDVNINNTSTLVLNGPVKDSTTSLATAGKVLVSDSNSKVVWTDATNIGGNVNGTGTTSYIAKWQDTDTIEDSIIFDNGSKVAVGHNAPVSKFEIKGDSNDQSLLSIREHQNSSILNVSDLNDAGVLKIGYRGLNQARVLIDGGQYSTGTKIELYNNSNTLITRLPTSGSAYINSGNLGVGTTSPSYLLDVSYSGSNNLAYPVRIKNPNGNGVAIRIDSNWNSGKHANYGMYEDTIFIGSREAHTGGQTRTALLRFTDLENNNNELGYAAYGGQTPSQSIKFKVYTKTDTQYNSSQTAFQSMVQPIGSTPLTGNVTYTGIKAKANSSSTGSLNNHPGRITLMGLFSEAKDTGNAKYITGAKISTSDSSSNNTTVDKEMIGLHVDTTSKQTSGNNSKLYSISNSLYIEQSGGTISGTARGIYNFIAAEGNSDKFVPRAEGVFTQINSSSNSGGYINNITGNRIILSANGNTAVTHNELNGNTVEIKVQGSVSSSESYLYKGSYNITTSGNANNRVGVNISGEERNYFSGNVGIGTTNPVYKLTVDSSNGLRLQDSGTYLQVFKSSGSTFLNTGTSGETIYIGAPATNTTNLHVQGDVESSSSSSGLILKSPNGTRYRVQVDNSGNLTTTAI